MRARVQVMLGIAFLIGLLILAAAVVQRPNSYTRRALQRLPTNAVRRMRRGQGVDTDTLERGGGAQAGAAHATLPGDGGAPRAGRGGVEQA